jgi:site-specific DNA-methyltransferase (adenine-specific)
MMNNCLEDYKYYFSQRFNLFNGNAKEVLTFMASNSIDSIVTDPPYELGFMGKSWDSTGIANDVQLWKEVLRVLKPGGHLLSFGGSRTYHRMAVAIEDAGFEIRDQIMWVYGSGFPKSLNIDKAIDKAAGVEREVLGVKRMQPDIRGNNYAQGKRDYAGDTVPQYITEPATAAAKQWQGWGTALKPAHEPIVLARKPVEGTVANNVLTYGVGGLNIDGTRVAYQGDYRSPARANGDVNSGGSFGAGVVPFDDAKAEQLGRFPANFIHDGSDEVVELFPNSNGAGGSTPNVKVTGFGDGIGNGTTIYTPDDRKEFNSGSGSAARFFYCAKASKRDRNEGLDGFDTKEIHRYGAGIGEGLTPNAPALDKNHHPTVKPTDLMQYLCRLITPPNGTILDPFLGSGSTGKAAMYEGFNFVGIELTDEYLPIAKARIEFALANLNEKLF